MTEDNAIKLRRIAQLMLDSRNVESWQLGKWLDALLDSERIEIREVRS